MKNKKVAALVGGVSIVFIGLAAAVVFLNGTVNLTDRLKGSERGGSAEEGKCADDEMNLGKFKGQVVYDKEKDYYFLQVRGARFPFKASPLEALTVPLEAVGKDAKEKNTSLLYGIMGRGVLNVTILVNPDEEEMVMPAAQDIARYVQMVNPKKFAGLAYTKPGGKLERSVIVGSQIQSLKEASSATPKIELKGPGSGGEKTRVSVRSGGEVIVEGKTYQGLYKAAALICVTLLKMLCGSADCPDAAACATGGNCGC